MRVSDNAKGTGRGTMRRLHGVEWEDQDWLPSFFRDFVTSHLEMLYETRALAEVTGRIAARLSGLVETSGQDRILDLCSGAGGVLVPVARRFRDAGALQVWIRLTDRFPNLPAFARIEAELADIVTCERQSLDARAAHRRPAGIRTLFTCLHHFRPGDAREILLQNARAGNAVFVFEPYERTARSMAYAVLESLGSAYRRTPQIARCSPTMLILTYVVPLLPFLYAWDGAVSALRTHSREEIAAMVRGHIAGGYEWEIEALPYRTPLGTIRGTLVIGRPSTPTSPPR